jgi:hypothetical protein
MACSVVYGFPEFELNKAKVNNRQIRFKILGYIRLLWHQPFPLTKGPCVISLVFSPAAAKCDATLMHPSLADHIAVCTTMFFSATSFVPCLVRAPAAAARERDVFAILLERVLWR